MPPSAPPAAACPPPRPSTPDRAGDRAPGERVVSPARIKTVLAFSADAAIRQSVAALGATMPAVELRLIASPVQLSAYRSGAPTVLVADDAALQIADVGSLRQALKDLVVVLFSYNEIVCCAPPAIALEKMPFTGKADLVFAVDRASLLPERVITSAVRAAEDLLNVERYSKARRFIFLLVDDEPRWFSQFLSVLYEIIQDRAAVKLVRTYEQAIDFIFGTADETGIDPAAYRSLGRGDDLVCLISDILFPRGGTVSGEAGRALVSLVERHYPHCPIIVASKAKEAQELSADHFVLSKGDYGSLEKLRRYILDFTGMGDLVIHGAAGEELHRARNLMEMRDLLVRAKGSSAEARHLEQVLEAYGERDRFSTWFYMHGYCHLGDTVRPLRGTGAELVAEMGRHLKEELARPAGHSEESGGRL